MQNAKSDVQIHVVGAGLAGSEAALQLADLGHSVILHEMRPVTMTPAHKTGDFAELVCSNSFGSLSPESAPGQLKWEAEQLNSFVLAAARANAVPAGQALGIDRALFAKDLTERIRNHPRIEVRAEEIKSLDDVPRPAIIATGPLTSPELSESLRTHFGGDFLYFFDAIAPIVDADSLDMNIVWAADRYDKGTPDYLNCPMSKEEYEAFTAEIMAARKIEPKDFEKTAFFEGCMPIEVMFDRGPETPRFGPMKPVGLRDPRTDREPWAVVQLRAENRDRTSYNLVGFQTRMAYGEQTRVFRMIPGLQNAEFLKLGSIHRNLFVNSPSLLNPDLSSRKDDGLFFAGQITGVEGYFESTCMGLLAARFVDAKLRGQRIQAPPRASAMGSILAAILDTDRADNFQPTNINFGLFPPMSEDNGKKIKKKADKKARQLARARDAFKAWQDAGLEANGVELLRVDSLQIEQTGGLDQTAQDGVELRPGL
ncbi:MAG: methylenetetrahydrofolate--tRNA-(uracil(54)-C(5))-methyltransferase (FADH(2)-oxidizing) TrmFO [Bdellovibrionaceae bacterium]|nr:methylenetetrahydrofolate--tRNA-(uracil(54)-C(5))-methyltransferase (FADH(2)-oxidizing) TrmFO [Pseudobdellovibrionaceae bacterium]